MTSEKRRQRQRVRHEAGESVTSDTNEQKEVDHKTECKPLPPGVLDKFLKNSSVDHTYEQKAEQKDMKRDCSTSNEKSSIYKNVSRGKGVRKDDHQVKQEGKILRTGRHTVAYEEEKEHEPVKIMPSSDISENESSNMKKYRRRDVISNWLRYEELPVDDLTVDGEDYLIGEDFSAVLRLHGNASSGGFLHLKGEMSWGDVNPSHLGTHGLGALKVADLAAALSTIPLHQQLKIPEESLPIHDIQMYYADAEINRKAYQPDKEYVTDIDINEAILKNLKLSISDTFSPSEEALNDDQSSLNATEKFKNAFEKSSEPKAITKDKFINADDVGDEYLELKQDQLSLLKDAVGSIKPELRQCVPKSEEKETCKADKYNGSGFYFGLPSKAGDESVRKKSVDQGIVLNNIVKPEVIIKNETQANEVVDPMVVCDSNEDGGKIPIEIPEPKSKEPISLVSKTEMEGLEDWLNSVLDD